MLRRIFLSLSFFGLITGFYLLTTFNLPILDSREHAPIIKNKNGTSTNWSGFAAYAGKTSDVKGNWVVPAVNCSGETQNTYSSSWVGIDGYSDSSVEQTGTEHDCINGSASYYAWYEMYPKPGYKLPLTINAGDNMFGEVAYQNGSFILTLTDTTTGKSYKLSQKMNKAQRSSAEWIMEAPWSGGVLPLANFGIESFSNSFANFGSGPQPISAFYPNVDQINMVNNSGATKDTTSSLDSTGAGFTVNWVSSN